MYVIVYLCLFSDIPSYNKKGPGWEAFRLHYYFVRRRYDNMSVSTASRVNVNYERIAVYVGSRFWAHDLWISETPLSAHSGGQRTNHLTMAPWASCHIRKFAGAHVPGMPGTFSPAPQVSDLDMHHGTCVTHVPWCMPGSLTSGFLWNRRREKRSRHSRRMRNLQSYVSGKRPIRLRRDLHQQNCFTQ